MLREAPKGGKFKEGILIFHSHILIERETKFNFHYWHTFMFLIRPPYSCSFVTMLNFAALSVVANRKSYLVKLAANSQTDFTLLTLHHVRLEECKTGRV